MYTLTLHLLMSMTALHFTTSDLITHPHQRFQLLLDLNHLEPERRELTPATSVTTQTEFTNAISNNVTINMNGDIDLSSSIAIENVLSLIVNGNGNTIDGADTYRVFDILDATVTFQDLIVQHGSTTVSATMYIVSFTAVVCIHHAITLIKSNSLTHSLTPLLSFFEKRVMVVVSEAEIQA
jgi:hypothetical protein